MGSRTASMLSGKEILEEGNTPLEVIGTLLRATEGQPHLDPWVLSRKLASMPQDAF